MTSALITGANRGLGLLLASYYHQEGYTVHATARDGAVLQSALSARQAGDVHCHQLDLDRDSADHIARVVDAISDLKLVIHNASPFTMTSLTQTRPQDFETYGRFFTNTFHLTQLCLRKLIQGKEGRFVFVGAVIGDRNRVKPNLVPYCAYKSAIRSLSEGVNREGSGFGVVSTYVNLGTMRPDNSDEALAGTALKESQVVHAIAQLEKTSAVQEQLDLLCAHDFSKI